MHSATTFCTQSDDCTVIFNFIRTDRLLHTWVKNVKDKINYKKKQKKTIRLCRSAICAEYTGELKAFANKWLNSNIIVQ